METEVNSISISIYTILDFEIRKFNVGLNVAFQVV